jgi:rod shape determining protein RodA
MMTAKNPLKRFWDWKSWSLIGVTLLLVFCGVLVLLGSSIDSETQGNLWRKQLFWFGIGSFGALVVAVIDYRIYLKYAYLFYGFSLVLLGLTLTSQFGHESHGAQSWLRVPGFRSITIQPAEFAKVAIILVLARVLARKQGQIGGLKEAVWPLCLVGVVAVLILAQPDLGTVMLLAPLTLGMLYLGGLPWIYLVLFTLPLFGFLGLADGAGPFLLWAAVLLAMTYLMRWQQVRWVDRIFFYGIYIGPYVAMPLLWDKLKTHQKDRLLVYWDPTYALDSAGYNLFQSKIAIGSGGFWGKGFAQGTQSRLEFLPKYYTDFTFAVLAEDYGFLGCMIFFSLFFLLLYLCLQIALDSRHYGGSLLAAGMAVYFFTHLCINAAMVMGMLPVAGLPLSFLSYGGSHLMACLLGIGLVLNVKMRRFA